MSPPAHTAPTAAPASTWPSSPPTPDLPTRALNAEGAVFARAGVFGAALGLVAALAPRLLGATRQRETDGAAGMLKLQLRDARRAAARRVAPSALPSRASKSWQSRLGASASRSIPGRRRRSRQLLADILYPGPKRGKR